MLTLFFEGQSSMWSFRTDPAESFRIDANGITDSSGQTIADREGGFWKARNSFYTHIECDGPVSVRSECTDGTSRTRSFGRVAILSGAITGDDSYVALFTETGELRHYRTLQSVAGIVLSGVDPASR